MKTQVARGARRILVAAAIGVGCISACSSTHSGDAEVVCGDTNSAPCPVKQICMPDANGGGAHCQTPPACGMPQPPTQTNCGVDSDCAAGYHCSLFLGVCLGGYCPNGEACDADNTRCIAAPPACGARDYGFDSCGPGSAGCPSGDLCMDVGSGPVCVGTACSDGWQCALGSLDADGVAHAAQCLPYPCSVAADCPAGSFCNCDQFQGAPSPKCGPDGFGSCAGNVGAFGACGQPFGNSVNLPAKQPGSETLSTSIVRGYVLCDPLANCPMGQVCSGGVCVGDDCKAAGEVCSPVSGVVPTLYGPAAMACVAPDGGSTAGEAGATGNGGASGAGGSPSAG
jgi:hypothetical protein